MICVTNQAQDIKIYFVKTDSNVNSTSNVAHQSNNSTNPNSGVSYLNTWNTASNKMNISMFPFETIIRIDDKGFYEFT